MPKIIVILLSFSLFGCFKKDESVVETFYKNMAVEKKFNEGLNLLSAETKSKINPNAQETEAFLTEMLSIPKYKSLYEFQAKRFDFKIEGVEEVGANAKIITVHFKILNLTTELMKYFDKESKKLNTEDAEKIFNDQFIAKYTVWAKRERDAFFINISQKVLITKENNKWVVEIKNTEDFIRELVFFRDLYGMSFFKVTDALTKRAYENALKKATVKEFLTKNLQAYGPLKEQIILCASQKAGSQNAYEYETKTKQSMDELIDECKNKIISESFVQ